MTRNQKIALGCGGAGCLGLIIIAVAGVIAFTYYQRRPTDANRNFNINTNANRSANTDSSPADGTPSSSNDMETSEESSSSSMSKDDQHKLFQAGAMTGDTELNRRIWKKLGFMSESGTMTGEYEQFVRDHVGWTMRNVDFIQSISAPEQARAYVEEHIND